AANWSTSKAKLLLSFRVMADRDASDAELSGHNVILFGTRKTNARIAAIANSLPLHLNPGAADYGLVYVYPYAGRYVVISSGLPWWTRLDQARRPGLAILAPAWKALQTFEDFIVFRGGLDNVVAEGRFDNRWKLPAESIATLKATGAFDVST
ncbi:MAG: hypothetical protein H7Y20_11815, partial [Bryobacteraceae bacterium]|nr:hypothetical protein [Bryobacteraceae bacterium]